MAIVELKNVYKDYELGKVKVHALKNVSLAIEDGDFISIAGPSGSGKTTLLNLVGGVDTATKGDVIINNNNTNLLSEKQLTNLRLFNIGFIFQTFNLILVLNIFQNVEFPLLLQKHISKNERKDRVNYFLEAVGLKDYIKHRPNELSGGQRQRVAIARALVTKPQIVLADEPTGNLDSKTGQLIIELMKEINQKENTTFIFSTHDEKVMQEANRIVKLQDGEVAN